jgi:hypothetical protein
MAVLLAAWLSFGSSVLNQPPLMVLTTSLKSSALNLAFGVVIKINFAASQKPKRASR